ncbi:uncharacterized protein B0H18DRAFT_1125269 [Fomitopsis serialis]|uniref:uncharacterized protein n=1 Tax=Fomitopsis serialis TaxID=139415 RepID=UPI002008B93F|nr:uncharacterized protein B0H18DRAFT_1125269 [Neoantrodia serialis]KAH9914833.1 hypothetical protein B0H18DRAFT_1125269 [Neoantrodia serialis]
MMRRSGASRAPSPTNTTYSGFSNYRTDSYRPINPPSSPLSTDPRDIARAHFLELNKYLASYLANASTEPVNSRATARQKLTRLTRQQFQELSTDVYDELLRRKNNSTTNEVPFLPVRDDFHPKRNQARQKLATLPTGRFKDLSSDVYYELSRRYPEFKEEQMEQDAMSPASAYDDYPSPDFPNNTRAPAMAARDPPPSARASEDRSNGYAASPSRRRPSDNFSAGRQSADAYGGVEAYGAAAAGGARRKPSQDVRNDRRKPSQDTAGRGAPLGGASVNRRPSESESSNASNAQSATAGMGMIIPNKSTIAEEELEVPYGREVRDSGSTARERERERERGPRGSRAVDEDRSDYGEDEGEEVDQRPGGLAALSARLQAVGDEDEARSGEDYFDKMSLGRASAASDRSFPRGGRLSVGAEEELRREYEFKVATMQQRITGLEREVEESREKERIWAKGEERVRAVEDELRELRQRMEEKTTAMFTMQQELEASGRNAQERRMLPQGARERTKKNCKFSGNAVSGSRKSVPEVGNADILDQLRSDMEGLVIELSDLSKRNDELMTAKDADLAIIRDLDAQSKEYKRKYEQAKTELRSVKATSQLFLQAPKTEDQLPVAQDGGLLDIHVTAFVTAIDSLLTAGRSNAPTRVLTPMKAVVNAATIILEDVKMYERRARRDFDIDSLRVLRERLEATLSNLVAASKTHATSSGMSPVSLLDAAASHVSSTVTEIGKLVLVRKATRAEQEQFVPPSMGATNGFSPALRSVDESRPAHQRGILGDLRGSPPSRGSSATNSPPPIFDRVPASHSTGGRTSDESAPPEGPEDAWAELKPYLEAQTESIVYAIQSVLSGVRSPTPPPTLNENLTQIITIVSSIVAVCKDNLPPASAPQGEDILRELGEHANRLSEVQAQPEVTKEARQVMAKSSFAVANAMKALMKL